MDQIKTKPPKAKVAAATVPPTREEELSKQLQFQQHQIDSLVGQVKKFVSAVKATRVSSRGAHTTDGPGMQPQSTWRGGSRGRVCLGRLTLEPLPSLGPETPRELVILLDVGNVGRWGTIEGSVPL